MIPRNMRFIVFTLPLEETVEIRLNYRRVGWIFFSGVLIRFKEYGILNFGCKESKSAASAAFVIFSNFGSNFK